MAPAMSLALPRTCFARPAALSSLPMSTPSVRDANSWVRIIASGIRLESSKDPARTEACVLLKDDAMHGTGAAGTIVTARMLDRVEQAWYACAHSATKPRIAPGLRSPFHVGGA